MKSKQGARFGDLMIGDKFFAGRLVFDLMSVEGEFYEKKSLSSAYILTPETLERGSSRRLFKKTFCGFTESTSVTKLA